MRRSFRDRFFTPPVARAITSPLGIILAGVGAALGIVLGGGIPLAIGLGATAWATRVATAIPRDAKGDRIDPFALGEPWRRFVQGALSARNRFDQAVQNSRPGPLRDRLKIIGDRVSTGVEESWRIARHGQAMADARSQVDTREAEYELAELAQSLGPRSADGPTQRTIEALKAQLAAGERMDRVIATTRDQLRLLDARMDEAVARAVELSVQAADEAELSNLRDDVDGLVGEMEALRQGLEAVDEHPATGTA